MKTLSIYLKHYSTLIDAFLLKFLQDKNLSKNFINQCTILVYGYKTKSLLIINALHRF
jgi:hypothetical protein